MNLPEEYLEQMQIMLGKDYPAYLASLEEPCHYGLRVNTLKITPEEFLKLMDEDFDPVAWNSKGFYYSGDKSYAKHPLYHAGLYYIQEPSAMLPAELLPVDAGDKILDMCAAPGGKSTALGAKLNGSGLLVSNDISASRAKALLKNIEFAGITNALVISMNPKDMEERWTAFFDKILIDAPCSGEGMFRKEPSMVESWKEHGPAYYHEIQKSLLLSGAKMLKPGGLMVYSTCTFSALEDESSIDDLLAMCPDMHLVETHRLFPHKDRGEGHFAVLLQKDGEDSKTEQIHGKSPKKESKDIQVFKDFIKKEKIHLDLDDSRLWINNEQLYYLPKALPEMKGIRVLRSGWHLGTIKKGRFEPSGAFGRGLYKEQCERVLDYDYKDGDVLKYLRCETLEVDDALKDGWYLVCASGYPLGFGKVAGGRLKNKYPAGWRLN